MRIALKWIKVYRLSKIAVSWWANCYFFRFLKQYWSTGVEYNGSGFSSPCFDELIALGESGADPVIRRNAVINAQQLMLDESVALFLGYPKINIVDNKHIDGIKMTPSEYYMITKDLKRK